MTVPLATSGMPRNPRYGLLGLTAYAGGIKKVSEGS